MVKSETRWDAEILVRNPSPSKPCKKRDFETCQKRFRDFEILPKFSTTHVFRGTICHPSLSQASSEGQVKDLTLMEKGEGGTRQLAPESSFTPVLKNGYPK